MNIQVIKSRRRTIGIEVHADGKVIVRTPLRMSSTEINRFIEEHDEWIRQKLDFVRQKSDNRHGTGAPGIECLLYYMPQELMDYVIVHELSHRRHMNHSAEFWEEVEKYCPEYRTYRKQLKGYELT